MRRTKCVDRSVSSHSVDPQSLWKISDSAKIACSLPVYHREKPGAYSNEVNTFNSWSWTVWRPISRMFPYVPWIQATIVIIYIDQHSLVRKPNFSNEAEDKRREKRTNNSTIDERIWKWWCCIRDNSYRLFYLPLQQHQQWVHEWLHTEQLHWDMCENNPIER